jgi:hypothetical protein
VGLAGLVLLAILLTAPVRLLLSRGRPAARGHHDPVTQAVAAGIDVPAAPQEETTRRRQAAASKVATPSVTARAFLRRLLADPLAAPGETLKPAAGTPIPLTAKEITFGTDPSQASHVLDDPSLAARLARITRTDGGDFFVVDAGTVAGTWVNFEPVGQEAHLLQHGDVIHFGQLIFRFELKEPPAPPAPKIAKENPEA